MTVTKRNLRDSGTVAAYPRVVPTRIEEKEIGESAGAAATFALLTPMAFNTSTKKWVPCVDSGANGTGTISGFAFESEGLVQNASGGGESTGNIMLAGELDVRDIPIVSGVFTLAQLKVALRAQAATLRAMGFDLKGFSELH